MVGGETVDEIISEREPADAMAGTQESAGGGA